MELYQLKSFLIIAREQNLTRAAEALHLSQSALSSQIKLLEEEFEVSLFERTSRGMRLTEQGRLLLAHAQDVLDAADKLQQQAATLSRGGSASVAIGLNTDPTFLRVSAINQRHSHLHSNTNVIFQICQSIDTAQRLRHGQIDLGFFYGENREPDIEHTVISQVRTCVVIPTRFATTRDLSWPEIAALPWIWVDNDFPFFGALQQSLQDFRTQPNQVVTAVDEQIVRELVVAGQGVAIMRDDEARPLVESGQVTIWNKGWGEIPLCLGWLSRNREETRVKAALDVIRYVWRKPTLVDDGSMTDKCWV
jgi:DNA-binding transcriptional LysR family regulator